MSMVHDIDAMLCSVQDTHAPRGARFESLTNTKAAKFSEPALPNEPPNIYREAKQVATTQFTHALTNHTDEDDSHCSHMNRITTPFVPGQNRGTNETVIPTYSVWKNRRDSSLISPKARPDIVDGDDTRYFAPRAGTPDTRRAAKRRRISERSGDTD